MVESLRIIAIADIHGRHEVSYFIRELHKRYSPDLILVAGDITNFGPADFALKFLNSIPGNVMAVPGNCDPPEVIDSINNSKAINLHKSFYEFKSYRFAGLGGVNGGFNLGITFDDDFAEEFLSRCEGCIYLLHQPPYGILDDVGGGKHIGSLGIRNAVENAKPILVISGHVHEARGFKKIGHTLFVNPGPAKNHHAALIELPYGNVNLVDGD